MHGGPRRLTARLALQGLVDRQLDGRQNSDRGFGEPHLLSLVARQITERRTLGPIDAHGNNHGIGLVGDHGGAIVDLHQAASGGETALGENHQRLAIFNRLDQLARAERLSRIDGVRVDELQERLHPPIAGHVGVDGEGGI